MPHSLERRNITPLEYKKIIADNYERLSAYYVSVMFPILIRLNYTDGEAVAEDMKRENSSNSTSPKNTSSLCLWV